jgi:hypothetical protein
MNTDTKPDLADGETTNIDHITDHKRGQMLNCLRIAKLRVGLILNFKHARLEWERLVL